MRKKGLLLLAALLALCGCTAQSNIADVSRRTMLTVVLWDYDKTSYDWKLIRAFEDSHPDVQVEVVSYPDAYYDQKMQARLLSGRQTDVFLCRTMDSLYKLYEYGVAQPLDELLAQYGHDLRDSAELVQMQFDGHQYGIPYRRDRYVLLYNCELFDRAGIPYPKERLTWEQVHELAQQMQSSLSEGEYAMMSLPMDIQWLATGKNGGYDNAESMRQIIGWVQQMQQERQEHDRHRRNEEQVLPGDRREQAGREHADGRGDLVACGEQTEEDHLEFLLEVLRGDDEIDGPRHLLACGLQDARDDDGPQILREEEVRDEPEQRAHEQRDQAEYNEFLQRDEIAEGTVDEADDAKHDARQARDQRGLLGSADVGADVREHKIEALQAQGAENERDEQQNQGAHGHLVLLFEVNGLFLHNRSVVGGSHDVSFPQMLENSDSWSACRPGADCLLLAAMRSSRRW